MIEDDKAQQANIDIGSQKTDSSHARGEVSVAAKSSTKAILVAMILIAISALVYLLFFSGSKKDETAAVKDKEALDREAQKIQKEASEVTKQQEVDTTLYEQNKQYNKQQTIELPSLEESEPPQPPPPPPPPPPTPPSAIIAQTTSPTVVPLVSGSSGEDDVLPDIASKSAIQALSPEAKKADDMRKKASIFVFGGGKGASSEEDPNLKSAMDKNDKTKSIAKNISAPTTKDSSGYMGFDGGAMEGSYIQESSAAKSTATQVKNVLC